MKPDCRLEASGFTETSAAVFDWATRTVRAIRKTLKGKVITARLWAYRHGAHQYLACDFSDDTGNCYAITFCPGGPHDYRLEELTVPDFSEALHMTGMVIRSLNATVEIGRHFNEICEDVLERPLSPGETNGPMKLAG